MLGAYPTRSAAVGAGHQQLRRQGLLVDGTVAQAEVAVGRGRGLLLVWGRNIINILYINFIWRE